MPVTVYRYEGAIMDQSRKPPLQDDLPSGKDEIAEQGEENRKAMDEIAPHGTDPLHEGP